MNSPVIGAAGNTTIITPLFQLLDAAGRAHASDVHIKPGIGVTTSIAGVLLKDPSPLARLPQSVINGWLEAAYDGHRTVNDALGERGHVSVAYDTGTYRVRASYRRDTTGVSATYRIIPYGIPNADELGIPQEIQALMRKKAGLILIEGPTSSGKTTAIAGLVNKVNLESDRHIYLIEDPIEFVHEPVGNTVFTQREIGLHASDYSSAVENALRSAPHVIIIGEMLDNATKKAALHAATTGHLVITTAHAGSVVEAIESFIGEFEAKEQPQMRSRLSQSLLAVMIQQLVPALGGGLVPVREIALADANVQGIIREGEMHMLHAQLEGSPNARSLEQSLAELVVSGAISTETAYEYTRKPEALDQHLRRKGFLR